MPNWLEGTFRARGEKENVNNFLLNAIKPVSFFGNDLPIEKENHEIQFACRFKAAWGLDREGLIKLAKDFNVDIKVNGFECGMEFTELLEVDRNGSVKSDSTVSYNDYLWDCDMCLLGG